MMKNNFSNEDIVNIVKDYLDDKTYSYAIMLEGEWGSGKTYFVKNILKDSIDKKIIYVSLYGIDSLDEISNAIIFSSMKNKSNKMVIASNLGINISKLLINNCLSKEAVKIKKELVKGIDFKGIFEDKILKDKLLIFDDLERCKLPLNELLGYINNYVEHQNIKVMIVANEYEITGKLRKEEEAETIFEEQLANAMGVKVDNKEDNDKKNKSKNPQYEKIKEKLIGQTIYYKPELDKILPKFIENMSMEDELKEFLLGEDKINYFIERLYDKNHINLRTFQSFLSKLNILYKKSNKLLTNDINDINDFIDCNMRSLFEMIVAYKKNENEIDDYYDIINENDKIIDNFIKKSILTDENIRQLFYNYKNYLEYKESKEGKIIFNIKNYWFKMKQSEIETTLEDLINKAKDNALPKRCYFDIIYIILRLSIYDMCKNFDLNNIIDNMKNNIDGRYIDYSGIKFINDFIEVLPETDEEKEKIRKINQKYNEIINFFEKLQIGKSNEKIINTIKEILNEEDWGEKLNNYINKNKDNFIVNYGYLKHINITLLERRIIKCNPSDIFYFRKSINTIYLNYRFNINDINIDKDNILKLKGLLEEGINDIEDKIVAAHVKWLINDLNTIINNIDKNES